MLCLLAKDAAGGCADADMQRQLVRKLLALRGQARRANLYHQTPAQQYSSISAYMACS